MSIATLSPPLVALCIGHSRPINGHVEGGAVSLGGMAEHTYNHGLALLIRDKLRAAGVAVEIVAAYEGNSYGSAQRWLAARLRAMGATAALELHFNAADVPSANGCEMLYWHTSANSQRLATELQGAMTRDIPEIKSRGLKALDSSDRGAAFCSGTHCPSVICEPGFGSNKSDWDILEARKPAIAAAYAAGVLAYLG